MQVHNSFSQLVRTPPGYGDIPTGTLQRQPFEVLQEKPATRSALFLPGLQPEDITDLVDRIPIVSRQTYCNAEVRGLQQAVARC